MTSQSSAVPRNMAATTPTARPSTMTIAIAVAAEEQGGGKAAQDDAKRGLVLPERGAEVAAEQVAEEDEVLNGQ